MPSLLLACLAYLSVALPGSTLGLLWPSMRLSFGQPVGALGILLVFGITASVVSSVATGRVRVRTGLLVAARPALGGYVVAFWLWAIILNLLLFPGYYDIALRDFGLSLAALALARLAVLFRRA